MICQSCGRDNRDDARFCDACGLPARPQPRSYTPRHLATSILQSRLASEGERKRVTVAFADIHRSMEAQEGLDPELWHEAMSRFFDFATREIHRHGGTINQYTGDGFMALFGAPIAHEDHARRACYAALDLRRHFAHFSEEVLRATGTACAVRMGLNSGEVIVGKIGDDLRMDYTAQGHTVGLASRIEQLALPGTVYVSEDTARLVDGYCRCEPRGVFQVRGVTGPLRLFELVDRIEVRSRFDSTLQRGLTRFVGRQGELSWLEDALVAATAGRGSTIALSGEAGIGKSRLCHELAEGARRRGVPVAYAQAFDHGDGIPFVTALGLLREIFAIDRADPAAVARAKIESVVRPDEPDVRAELPLLFEFIGAADPEQGPIGTDPSDRNRQLLRTIREVVQRRGRQAPLLILLEDLHWLDRGSATVVDSIVQGVEGSRILFVCNFRPGFSADWLGRPGCRVRTLHALDTAHSTELARVLLPDGAAKAELVAFVTERAGGNPFFAEEIVRSLAERTAGAPQAASAEVIEALAIPPRVDSLLAARIDRLPDDVKSVLQDAAVIGRFVRADLLARVAEIDERGLVSATRLLIESGFLREIDDARGAGYAFAHPLTHSVAYRSQLAALRRRRHHRAATALEESAALGDRSDEGAALLAYHWEHGGEPLRAARAGARLARWLAQSDPRQSLAQWSKVHRVAVGLEESEDSLRLVLRACAAMLRFGWRQGLARADAERLFEQARGIARRLEDARTETLLTSSFGRMMGTIDSASVYLGHARHAAELAGRVADRAVVLVVEVVHCQALGWTGRLRESLALAERILERDDEDAASAVRHLGFSAKVWARAQRGWLLTDLGRLAEARHDLAEAIERSREEKQHDILPMASRACVSLHWMLGDVASAMREATAAAEHAERLGSPYALVGACWGLGRALLMRDAGPEARDTLERALAVANERVVYLESEGSMLGLLAEAEAACGRAEHGLALAERAVASAVRRGMRVSEAEARLSLGRIQARFGEEGRRRAALEFERMLSISEAAGARALAALAHAELAGLSAVLGDAATAAHRRRARSGFLAMGADRRADAL